MKPKLVFLTICLMATARLPAAATNGIYLPVNWAAHVGVSNAGPSYQQQVEASKNQPECRPAELDPEGHWGEIVAGLQMSIRLATNRFILGSPIATKVILRNTTTNSIAITAPSAAVIGFVATDERHNILRAQHHQLTISGPSRATLPGHRQVSYDFNLTELFNFKSPGTYHIHAERQIGLDGPSKLSSGDVVVNIVPAADQK